jgi:2-polyprenyl-3-methyl-5-hydroxy-6-metoxy-1,4-benzoquinol methylase|tara:strand:+ start:1100 stop:1735 length:636 start_codon:yes stop_codon:yes gene_type:complete
MFNLDSYNNHNSEYVQNEAFEREKEGHLEHDLENFKFLYQDDLPHGNNLDTHTFTTAVDIGAGTGWFANYLVNHRKYTKVYAIEPSQAAVNIAQKLYPDQKKVKYIVGFAEEELNKLKLRKPAFFSTMCVLAHLCDEDVADILKAIDKVAPVGSVWSASEPWGDEYHRDCWHIRTPQWWSDNMADWEFEFYADYALTDPLGRHKGFTAIKS